MAPGYMSDAQIGKEVQSSIRQILLDEWDPLGAKGIAADEYDVYIGPLYRLLSSGASAIEVAEYLASVERDQMAISAAPPTALLGPAEALCRLRIRLHNSRPEQPGT